MAIQVVNYILHVKGAGKNTESADNLALKRLQKAATSLAQGKTAVDPGVDSRIMDPGGGGGPCEPIIVSQEFDVGPGALPEAQRRDDDD